MLNVQIPGVVVVGDKPLRPRLLINPYDGRWITKLSCPYFADNVDFIPSFSLSSCLSALKMTLSATAKCFDSSYDPGDHGGEPFEISLIEMRLSPNSARTAPFVELDYQAVEKATNTVDDVYHHERHKTRTITQKLRLTKARWAWIELLPPYERWHRKLEPPGLWKSQPLPCELFDSLGLGQVDVEAAFDKKGSIYRTPEEWIARLSDVQHMSVSFENLTLPTSPSLLKLFPKEVLEGLHTREEYFGFNLL